jgi:hypothetical protein
MDCRRGNQTVAEHKKVNTLHRYDHAYVPKAAFSKLAVTTEMYDLVHCID